MQYVHQDSLSSTSLTTDSSGAVIATVKYFPFGVCRNSQGNLDTDKLFTGQRLDDTGLYYYNARYYDATIGRFISADTIVQDYKDPQTLNRYSYCLNNPLKYIDPTGHNWLSDLFSNAWETVKGWSQAARDTLDWVLADKSASERGEDIKTQAKFYWENRDWVISSVANIGMTVLPVYGLGIIGKSFIKSAMTDGIAARYAMRNPSTPEKVGITNPIPTRLARVIPGEGPFPSLGKPGDSMVHVTAAEDIAGLNAQQIYKRLQIEPSDSYTVIEFSVNMELYSAPSGPVVPNGGARQWLIPNGPIPADATITIVQ